VNAQQWPTARDLADAVRGGKCKATELLDLALDAIERLDPLLNAWVELDIDQARRAAEAVDAAVARGDDPGPFAGVPLAVKDLEDMAGLPTREGSELFRSAPAAIRDSVHLARLRAAGAVPIGKTTTPEFGMTAQTTTKAFGTTRNPWNRNTTPGGSSGGSGSAVASGMVPIATASDGGGSTRIPASFNGLVGLKPSHGRIPYPRPGEQSVLGLLSISVVDAARHLDVVAGPHGSDHQSLPAPGLSYADAISTLNLSGLRAAWSPDLGWIGVDSEVAAASEDAARHIAKLAGLTFVERPFRLPNSGLAWSVLASESILRRLSALGHWPGRADELDDYTRMSIDVRNRFGPEHLYHADERRRSMIQATADLFEDVDVLFTPTTPMTAPAAVGPMPEVVGGRDARLAGSGPFTAFVNFAWNPAIAVPIGLHSNGMPMSLQIVGPRHRDEVPLRLARLLELDRPWPQRPAEVDEREALPHVSTPPPPIELLERLYAWAIDPGNDGTVMSAELIAEITALVPELGGDQHPSAS
jgi:aspartyl-tRNA(Asn)/glutamyl-tRNA(Gln) amidotransferase subunit A